MFPESQSTRWEERFQSLKTFLVRWYGEFGECDGIVADELRELPIPAVLREFSGFAGRRPEATGCLNQLVAPFGLRLETSPFVFYVESQGVYLWAIENTCQDPPVYGKINEEHRDWQREEESLCGFLCQLCVFEAVMGAPYGASASWCAPEELARILEHWTPLPFGPWNWPAFPTEFYCTSRALAVVCPNDDAFTFKCGARSAESLEFMREFVDEGWEYVALD